ncbi:MAG TPA: Rieske (2Fe-2S) protein [Tepidisphaeraceae bacterium]|jgi:Rieske Fe-S protein|nr:Rieske (2Fe-2S) protein [Tepidisphaeraceae bacterium]
MEIDRRKFLILATASCCAGCAGQNGGGDAASSAPAVTKVIDAGPREQYAADGVYDHFRHRGFFIVRENAKLIALSSDCTHRDCPVRALADRTFSCRCHGSRFDEQGQVLRGPATRALPQFPTTINGDAHLIVQVTRLHFDEE